MVYARLPWISNIVLHCQMCPISKPYKECNVTKLYQIKLNINAIDKPFSKGIFLTLKTCQIKILNMITKMSNTFGCSHINRSQDNDN